ncbi:MAG TPA: ABC transporter permease [Thermoguttaceae bacterium]|nr:ABC transporter permease [Thermoguttaceae bacterium]
MDELRTGQEAQQTLIVFQANKFCPATSHLPRDYTREIARLPGVRGVVPIQVFTNNCRASLDVVVFHGLPPDRLRQIRRLELVSGDWSQFERNRDAALVGRAVANRRPVGLGDKFSIGDLTVTVAGVFSSDSPAEENYTYTHLDFLERRKGADLVGTVTQLEILLEPGVNPGAKCEEIDHTFRSGPVETDTRPKSVFEAKSLSDLADLIELAHYLGLACVGLVLALVATTTLMSVQDRVTEYAILQTIGFSAPRLFGLVVAENILLSLAGGAFGVGAAMLILTWSNFAVGAEAVTVAFQPSLSLAFTGITVASEAGLLAGVVPDWQAAAPAVRCNGAAADQPRKSDRPGATRRTPLRASMGVSWSSESTCPIWVDRFADATARLGCKESLDQDRRRQSRRVWSLCAANDGRCEPLLHARSDTWLRSPSVTMSLSVLGTASGACVPTRCRGCQ